MTNPLIANFALNFDFLCDEPGWEEWVDDDFQWRRDALDCVCVPFDATVDAELAIRAYKDELADAGFYEPLEPDWPED